MPFGLQPIHLIIIAIVALLIFGPRKLPEMGRSMGRAITEFRRGTKEMSSSFMEEISQPADEAQQQNQIAHQPQPVAQVQSYSTEAQPVAVTGQNGSQPEPGQANFCIHCGNANPAGAVYCNRCGSKINE